MANEKKTRLLGMNFSTASNALRKHIIYSLAVQLGLDQCSQINCVYDSRKIELVDFSIDHKTPWMGSENPQETFFDMSNISFSHLKCNSLAGVRLKGIDHPNGAKTHCLRGHSRWRVNKKTGNRTCMDCAGSPERLAKKRKSL